MSSTILIGSVFDILPTLPDQSVNCCVTSPPYWGLRDYGTATWEGGDAECGHKKGSLAQTARSTLGSNRDGVSGQATNGHQQEGFGRVCAKCGARRIDSQLGLEATPEQYVERMVAVFAEVKRVLRDDGTLWLNLGDSYATGSGSGRSMGGDCFGKQNEVIDAASYPACQPNRMPIPGLKPKDLCGIPWRVAFALQADGWYLRSDIIWAKPNPMPESVTDRPTKSHEYLFLLSKRERYWYDPEPVRLPVSPNWQAGKGPAMPECGYHVAYEGRRGHQAQRFYEKPKGANIRTVWTIATQPFPEAHFATFPEKLVEPCVLAGCPEGGTVLDPFAGSGTTGVVAYRLGRKFVGVELNPEYAAMAERRIAPWRDQQSLALSFDR